MKRVAALLVALAIVALPMAAGAQTTTRTAFQVVNLSQNAAANVHIIFYDLNGNELFSMDDSITAGSSETYIQENMSDDPPAGIGSTFNGSAVVYSDQEVAGIINQNTSDSHDDRPNATRGYNGSYTGFTQGSDIFYIPWTSGHLAFLTLIICSQL
jgi:hypothetical protein